MNPRENGPSGRRLKYALPIMGILLGAILVAAAVWFVLSSQRASKKAVLDVSNFYLSELTTQTVGHFQTSLDGQTAQLQMAVSTVTREDLEDLSALQAFIREAVEVNRFDFLAYVDRNGMIYTTDAVFPGISKIDGLVDILDSAAPSISVNQTLGEENMVLITLPVHKDFGLAVERFQASPVGHYDLILMDIQMPRMDGLEATRRIRAMDQPDAASVSILAMSANAFSEDVERSLQSGMDGHLSKPINVDEVYAQIGELFSRRTRSDGLCRTGDGVRATL